MEVSSTSSDATALLPANNDDNEDQVNSTGTAATSTTSTTAIPLAITNGDIVDKGNMAIGAGDCNIVDSACVPYGPVIGPHFYSSDSSHYSKDVKDSTAVHGSSGLYNLGNTCYMNSGLQSLISCGPLVKFFAERYAFAESNHHTLTYHFYVLLCKVWSGQFSVVHPKTFKDFMGLYHSQFEDYRQHDCQEFLAFLLDTLHEQLNESNLSNNACAAVLMAGLSESVPKKVSCGASPLPSTSRVSHEDEKSLSECPPTDHATDKNPVYGIDKNGDESADFAVVSATSSSPQSLDGNCEKHGNEANFDRAGECLSLGSSSSSHVSNQHSTCSNSDLVERSDCDYISVSCPSLRKYTSRSNLEDVTSSDMGPAVKPSLKRVSSDSGVTASGLVFLSEDSNQSSVSVHSTDSEQSSAFKKLKIDSLEMNKNSNSSNNSQKDFVSSSSDCKSDNPLKVRNERLDCIIKCNEVVASSSSGSSGLCPSSTKHNKTVNVTSNSASSVRPEETTLPSVLEASSEGDKELPNDLEDFYRKETKTLNTNVLISERGQEIIACDSEKFAKVDNRNRPPSKEINLLQEAFGEEDKVDKVLISQHFGLKDTNLLAEASTSVVKSSKSNATKVLNNSSCDEEEDLMICSSLTKLSSPEENVIFEAKAIMSPLKTIDDGDAGVGKLDEVEKNVQMQAYSKFNTIPARSNIRTDLIDVDPVAKSTDADEVEEEESSDEEEEEAVVEKGVVSPCCSADNCSSMPNCFRSCSQSDVAEANEAWLDYKAKNDSVVVSTFQGQFRSTVVCSECNHVSVTYEPFMYLSLPIPHAMEQQLCITFISMSKPPIRYLLNLLKTDKIGTAKKKLKELLTDCEGEVLIAEMLDLHVSRILDDNVLLKYVNTLNRKIYAFEVVNALGVISNGTFADQQLNNCDDQHPSVLKEGLCLRTSATEGTVIGRLRRSDSQISNQSLDSITANSPTSRDAMDLGFSDSEMCESSSIQDIGLASSYFHEERKEEDDICQSTSDEPEICFQSNSNETISSTTCLSWKIVDDKNSETVSEMTVADEASRSPSSQCDDDEGHAFVSTSCSNKLTAATGAVKRRVDLGFSSLHHSRDEEDSNSSAFTLGRAEKGERKIAGGRLNRSGRGSQPASEASSCVMDLDDEDGDRGTHNGSSRSCPSPEGFVCQSDQTPDILFRAAGQLSQEGAASPYFLQGAPQFDSLAPICQTDAAGDMVDTSCSDEDPPIMGTESHCVSTNWSGLVPLPAGESNNVARDPLLSTVADAVSTSGNVNPRPKGEVPQSSIPITVDQWRSCAICLEDLPSSQLLTHVSCDGVFCQNCLDMSVKHTADVSAYCCPICLQPASICDDFIHLPSSSNDAKSNMRMLPVCLTYRHCVVDNSGASSLQLLGHPNILQLPSVISGDALYALVDRLLARPIFTYSIMLTDGQGLSCSRCPYTSHCSGCEVAREGDLTLHPSDCLTVHSCEMLSPDEVVEMQHVYDDVSVEGLRSSEPITLMDCFRAFTQSELLDEHNPWYCPQCERNQCAKKTMTVWRYPDNLIIHLKRFVYQDLSSTKVDAKVTFPHQALDVRGFLSGPSSSPLLYDLHSVICHFGGASAGHYTCFAKHPLTSQWNYYNDETVSPQTPSESEHTCAYVLFYQRQGTEVEFSPPQYSLSMDDRDSGVTGGDGKGGEGSSAFVPSSSMALVPFDPPVTTSSSCSSSTSSSHAIPLPPPPPLPPAPLTKKPAAAAKDDSNEEAEDDDYDYERRCFPSCDYDELTVHFGMDFPEVEEET